MYLTEKHIINKKHLYYNECDELCFKSKNLYNQGLYNIRQHYFENKNYLNYESNYHITKLQESYDELPTKVSCQTLKLVDNNFKSFFGQLNNEKLRPKIPKYLDKLNGRFITKFPKQALGLREFKKTGRIYLSKSNIFIKTKINNWDDIKEVRIVPRIDHYVIEVVYEKLELEQKKDNNKYLAVDHGVNNLATCTSNDRNIKPFIINGRPLKSINQYYNKKLSILKSKVEKENSKKTSKNIVKLTNKRNNKINDYLHKASRLLVNQLVSNNINTLIVGKNIGQKQDTNMSKVNNQNFINIPTFRFIDMLEYKCKLLGINVIINEESYTSRASFLDLDPIPVYGDVDIKPEFSGYRMTRGLYKIKKKKIYINSDVNGSYNILRKAFPNAFNDVDGIEGIGVCPLKLNVNI